MMVRALGRGPLLVLGVLMAAPLVAPAAEAGAGASTTTTVALPASDYKLTLPVQWPAKASRGDQVVLRLQSGDDRDLAVLTVTAGSAELRGVGQGGALVRSRVRLTTLAPSLTIDRRGGRLRLLAGQALALEASLPGGETQLIAEASSPAVDLGEATLQPVEAVWFSDDFMRAAEASGDWEPVSGSWAPSGVSEENVESPNEKPVASFSANPFAYRAAGSDGASIAVAGQWFWDTYLAEVSVRPGFPRGGQPTVGLLGYWQDADNYLAFEWSYGAGQVRRLVSVIGGERQVLAEGTGGWRPDQWYRLGLRLADGMVTGLIDGKPVLHGVTRGLAQGKIGLLAKQVSLASFDDAQVAGLNEAAAASVGEVAGLWHGVGGTWQAKRGLNAPDGSPALALVGADSLMLTDVSDGSGARVGGWVRPGRRGVGLGLAMADARNGLFVRWDKSLRLEQLVNSKRTVLAEAQIPAPTDQWSRLEATQRGDSINVSVDGRPALAATVPGAMGHLTGWWGTPGTAVAGLSSEPLGAEPAVAFAPEVASQFAAEDLMATWSRPDGSWYHQDIGKREAWLWYRYPVYGPVSVAIDAPRLWVRNQPEVTLSLAGADQQPDTGYELHLKQSEADRTKLACELTKAGTSLATADADLQDVEVVRFSRDGRLLSAWLDDRRILAWTEDGEPLTGTQVGLKSSEPDFPLATVTAQSPNAYDTTFSSAPWQWWETKGIWETTNRWMCDPRWSFFGGFGDENPVIWSKQAYGGDMQLDAYLGVRMDARHSTHYLHPADLGVTIAGDGQNLTSGYSFLFAAQENTKSILYRNGSVLAENAAPEARFKYVSSEGEGLTEFHRHWFHMVIKRSGKRIVASMDDQVIFDVEDPDPLPGGQIALYGIRHGLNIARLRVSYQRLAEASPAADWGAQLAAAKQGSGAPSSTDNDFEAGLGAVRCLEERPATVVSLASDAGRPGQVLEMTNLVSGGSRLVRLAQGPIELSSRPMLRLSYRIPADVFVNLYASLANGARVAIPLTASSTDGAVGDGQWHDLAVDLGAALVAAGQDGNSALQSLDAGMLEPEPYLAAGFTGNPVGSTWNVDDLSFGPR